MEGDRRTSPYPVVFPPLPPGPESPILYTVTTHAKEAVLHMLILIAAGGAAGALARWGLSGLVQRAVPWSVFPWGTLAVNLTGCFLFGVLWSAGVERFNLGPEFRIAVFIGFLGSFTTFSTFAFETAQLTRDFQWLAVAGNLLAQNAAGVFLIFLGFALGRLI